MKKRLSVFLFVALVVSVGLMNPPLACAWDRDGTQSPGQAVDLSMLQTILDTLAVHSRDSLDLQECAYKIFQEGIGSIDEYASLFVGKQEIDAWNGSVSGSYSGIGMQVLPKDGRLLCVPFGNTPAQLAGIKSGDIILRVDSVVFGKDAPPEKAVALIRGPGGTTVSITLYRDGAVIGPLVIVRQTIHIPVVVSGMVEDDIGYIKINQFTQSFEHDLGKAILDLRRNGKARKFVIDVRDNPGGYLQPTILALKNIFSPGKGNIVLSTKSRGNITPYLETTEEGSLNNRRPIVILQNRGSASAAEIFAGVLLDWGIAESVGDTTFGKGSIQKGFYVPARGSMPAFQFKITIAEYLVGNAMRKIDKVSLPPTYFVPDSLVLKDTTVVPMDEARINLKTDGQLQKAVEILRKKVVTKE